MPSRREAKTGSLTDFQRGFVGQANRLSEYAGKYWISPLKKTGELSKTGLWFTLHGVVGRVKGNCQGWPGDVAAKAEGKQEVCCLPLFSLQPVGEGKL